MPDAGAIVSPFYYQLSPASVDAYLREIALHSPIDVTLYNIPVFASPIDLATIRRLAELERIVRIKDSSGDLPPAGRSGVFRRSGRPLTADGCLPGRPARARAAARTGCVRVPVIGRDA